VFENKFYENKKNTEWQRENIATFGVMKYLDPIKNYFIALKDFIILEVAMFYLCQFMILEEDNQSFTHL
jgi:hypothetical protein